ncbi:MAG: MFS transporter [Isosphaeraceae bacterium]
MDPFEESSRRPAHDPYAVLREPNYVRYLMGGMCATVGGQVQNLAVGWELYERTGAPSALAYVGLAQVVPVFLLAIPAGQAADRYSRVAQLILAATMRLLAALGLLALSLTRGPVAWTYACLAVGGVGVALSMPARWSLLQQVVPRDQVTSAVTWNSTTWQVAAMVGPSLGGAIIALTRGAAAAYAFDAACSVLMIALTAGLKLRPVERVREPLSAGSLAAGVRFVFRTELILATITLDLFAVLLGGATALLPVYAKDVLHVGPTGLGWLRAAPSVGAFVTALFLAHRPPMRRAGRSLLWSVAGFGAATIVFGFSTDPYLSFAMLALTGAFDNVSVVVRQTLVQVLTPDSMRGRVSAVNAIFIGSSNQLGEFESGMVAEWFGPVAAVVGGGVGTVLVVLGVAALWPGVLRLGSLHEVPRAEAEGA